MRGAAQTLPHVFPQTPSQPRKFILYFYICVYKSISWLILLIIKHFTFPIRSQMTIQSQLPARCHAVRCKNWHKGTGCVIVTTFCALDVHARNLTLTQSGWQLQRDRERNANLVWECDRREGEGWQWWEDEECAMWAWDDKRSDHRGSVTQQSLWTKLGWNETTTKRQKPLQTAAGEFLGSRPISGKTDQTPPGGVVR